MPVENDDEAEGEADDEVNEGWERYHALDSHQRVEAITRRLEQVRDAVGARAETRAIEDEDGTQDRVQWRGVLAEDRRSFALQIDVEMGRLVLNVSIRNQLGLFVLRRDFDEVPESCVAFGATDHAVHADSSISGAESILSRMSSALVADVAKWMDDGGVSELAAADERLRLELFGFVFDVGYDHPAHVARLLDPDALPRFASFFEHGGDIACPFCHARFIPTPTRRCPHCGAPMG